MAIHDFDMARWLLNEEPTQVFAGASCLVDPAIAAAGDVDTARILLRTDTGRLCVISNTRGSASDALQNFFLERYAEAYRHEMRHFADMLRDGKAPVAGYRDGIAALVLAEAAALSVKLNKPVNISSV